MYWFDFDLTFVIVIEYHAIFGKWAMNLVLKIHNKHKNNIKAFLRDQNKSTKFIWKYKSNYHEPLVSVSEFITH